MKIVATVDGIPADVFFKDIQKKEEEAKKTYNVMQQTYEMTHVLSFRNAAISEIKKIREYREIIQKNMNLYYIVTKGYGLN